MGSRVQGGTSTGRRLSDACALRRWCRSRDGSDWRREHVHRRWLGGRTRIAASSSRTRRSSRASRRTRFPRVDVQVSGTWSSNPGDSLAANYTVTNAIAAAVARPQSLVGQRHGEPDRAGHAVCRSAEQHRLPRREDLPVSAGRGRQVGVDIYNLTNTDVVTSYNQSFVPGGAWLTPTGIQPARYVKISAQFDF